MFVSVATISFSMIRIQ